jgi:site-specific recombinase XerD
MKTTVNALCYKSKTLSNGENPLMIRICKDGKKKYKSLGISLNPIYWDFKKSKPKAKCPNKTAIEKFIFAKKEEIIDEIVKLESERKEFTVSTLVDKISQSGKPETVNEVFLAQIQRLSEEKRRGYMLSTQQVYNSLIKYNKHLNIYFSEIDVAWLRKYETWLRKNELSENTIGIRFRTLRAIYNIAMEKHLVKLEQYPFKSYKVSKLHKETAKRAITKEEINKVMTFHTLNKYSILAIDLFSFSYLMGGINFVDMAYLTKENILDDRLIYTRRKTKKLIKLPLQNKAIELVNKYHNPNNPYLFPILSLFHKTEIQQANRVHKVITNVNKHLKQIGRELNIPIDLTTYVARHSFATVLKRSGVSTSIICESLGHSSEKVTQIYLDSFDNIQIDEAMKNLL